MRAPERSKFRIPEMRPLKVALQSRNPNLKICAYMQFNVFSERSCQSHVRISYIFNNLWYQKYGVSYDNCHRSNAHYHMLQLECLPDSTKVMTEVPQKYSQNTISNRWRNCGNACNEKMGEMWLRHACETFGFKLQIKCISLNLNAD